MAYLQEQRHILSGPRKQRNYVCGGKALQAFLAQPSVLATPRPQEGELCFLLFAFCFLTKIDKSRAKALQTPCYCPLEFQEYHFRNPGQL